MIPFAVILPAAGQSTRFGQRRNKLFEPLGGRSVLAHSVEAFLRRGDVGALIIPTNDVGRVKEAMGSLSEDRRVQMCEGGPSRAHSVRLGAMAVAPSIEWVAIHDAARPLVSQELIDRTLGSAIERGAAAAALPIHLTIKQAAGPLPARIERTIPRQRLWAMQTPQVMRRVALLEAFNKCPAPLESITDDVQLLELAGQDAFLVQGEERNLKITTAMDLEIAEMILGGGR
jgi:2-C-methyl-D-erythritol 4-phosphate cytidylyltransferase